LSVLFKLLSVIVEKRTLTQGLARQTTLTSL